LLLPAIPQDSGACGEIPHGRAFERARLSRCFPVLPPWDRQPAFSVCLVSAAGRASPLFEEREP
jgi:hypothetical protein